MVAKELSAILLVEKKSKFYAHLYQIDTETDILQIKTIHEKLYTKAVHHCYALKCGDHSEFKSNGEVGSPGRILMDTLNHNNLNNHVIIISRIFGGIKLGPAGVGRAFRQAGLTAILEYKKKSITTSNN